MTVLRRNIGLRDKKLDRRPENLFNKTLFIQVNPEIHNLVKERALERNISIRQWVTRAVVKELKEEFKPL
jgi:predicted HicB family RNase H-like nuclease